jgi:hypothetical protein
MDCSGITSLDQWTAAMKTLAKKGAELMAGEGDGEAMKKKPPTSEKEAYEGPGMEEDGDADD